MDSSYRGGETMTTRTLYTAEARNLEELKAAIDLAMVETRVAFKDQKNADEVLLEEVLSVALIEYTLTDGSKVYNLNIE
jgi:hypothetical protein